jgi:transposase-like protein
MPSYSDERRQAVVAKLLPPSKLSIEELARQECISSATIYKWRKEARAEGRCLPDSSKSGTDGWSSRDKFAAVIETACLNAEEIAAYCRRRSIFTEQLKRWRYDCEQAASLSYDERRREAAENKEQRQRIRELERDLQRKNKALAETAALLVLSKKARAIWGDAES